MRKTAVAAPIAAISTVIAAAMAAEGCQMRVPSSICDRACAWISIPARSPLEPTTVEKGVRWRSVNDRLEPISTTFPRNHDAGSSFTDSAG